MSGTTLLIVSFQVECRIVEIFDQNLSILQETVLGEYKPS